jgi:hypothetical protein
MFILQRTRDISKEDWNTLKSVACDRFGKKEYLELLKYHDDDLPKPRSQEAPVFAKKNLLLAAMKAEEVGGREEWESRIPKVIETVQNNTPLEMMMLFQELNMNVADRRKMTANARDQISNWVKEEQKIRQLMDVMNTAEMQVPENHVFQPGIYLYWSKLRAEWCWQDETTSTEEVL